MKFKDIYVFQLHKVACNILNAGSLIVPGSSRRPAVDCIEEEFFSINLGDQRANERLMTFVRDFYARPQANIPQACQTRSRTKAVHCFMDKDTAPHPGYWTRGMIAPIPFFEEKGNRNPDVPHVQ